MLESSLTSAPPGGLTALWSVAPDAGRPLVVALHGFGSNESDLAPLRSHLGNVDQVSLRAPHTAEHGYLWFPIRVPGTPDVDEVNAAATRVAEWVASEVPVDRPVVLLGFSQGGTTALQAARLHPGRYRAVVVLSGYVAPGEAVGDAELRRNPLPVFWGRDVEDPVIAPVAIERTTTYLAEHARATCGTYPGIGHGIGRGELADLREFLAAL